MKKVIRVFALALAMTGFVACSGTGSSSQDAEAQAAEIQQMESAAEEIEAATNELQEQTEEVRAALDTLLDVE